MLLRLLAIAALLSLAACGRGPDPTASPVQTVRFDVEGMHCGSCVAAITAAVKDLDGVRECSVSLEEKSAVVTIADPAAPDRVIDRVTRMGYTVKRHQPSDS